MLKPLALLAPILTGGVFGAVKHSASAQACGAHDGC
jgi:hypothetical protein